MGVSLGAVTLRLLTIVPQPVAAPGQINHPFLDPYSLVHAAVGALLAALGARLGILLFITVGWELAERVLKDFVPAIFPHPTQDTLANSAGDILSALAAWYLYRRATGHGHDGDGRHRGAHAGGPLIRGSRSRP